MDTTWTDTALFPSRFYSYRVRTVAGDLEQVTEEFEVVYDLPPADLLAADVRYPGKAEVRWQTYQGPRFEAYEVRRTEELEGSVIVKTVAEVTDIDSTLYVDRVNCVVIVIVDSFKVGML